MDAPLVQDREDFLHLHLPFHADNLQQTLEYVQVNSFHSCYDVSSMPPPLNSNDPLIPLHGGYRNLKTFQLSQLLYDVTVRFCDRYIDKRSRTHDQMVQAARSGVQNIAEASQGSATSKKFELKLTNVARASLEELRLDYEDFLRQRELEQYLPSILL